MGDDNQFTISSGYDDANVSTVLLSESHASMFSFHLSAYISILAVTVESDPHGNLAELLHSILPSRLVLDTAFNATQT